MDGTATVGDPEGLLGPAAAVSGERSVPPVTLRSVQLYKTQDEYIVVMKEDLAEWLNELYDMTMTADELFDRLETGVLLCRYACTVDDVLRSSRGILSETVVYRERGVEPGSFQARVNVAAFLTWCRRLPLRMPDDVLFETGDLICQRPAERNERQVALSLLEVGRRSAALKVGLPAPELVRLEAEIDAEIRADDSALTTTNDVDNDDDDDESPSSSPHQSSPVCRSESAGRGTRTIKAPSVVVNRGGEVPTVAVETPPPEKRGYVWQRRRYRPVIPVDMMTLDEMVRQILSRCTCPNQYPMIRVSEGKYRIGDNLTLIFVRILRQHVMVRIGGGWNTLENYLARCDPCRCQKNSAVSPTAATFTSSAQSATPSNKAVSDTQRQFRVGDQPKSSSSAQPLTSSSSSDVTMTTTSGQQQPTTRRLGDLLMTSQALPVDDAANCRSVHRSSSPTTTDDADALLRDTDDVTLDSAASEAGSSCRDNSDHSEICRDSEFTTPTPQTSDNHVTSITSTSSSPSITAAETATSTPITSTPVGLHTSHSCTLLMGLDDARRQSLDSRPSRIPVPLRLIAQSEPAPVESRPSRIPLPVRVSGRRQSHSASFSCGRSETSSPINRQLFSHQRGRCDSGVDLNLSSPDFD